MQHLQRVRVIKLDIYKGVIRIPCHSDAKVDVKNIKYQFTNM